MTPEKRSIKVVRKRRTMRNKDREAK